VALLSGARNEKNSHLSQEIYDRMKKLFPQSDDLLTSASTLLANVYGSIGDIDRASDIRTQLNKSNAKKKIGLSWTVINGQLYVIFKYKLTFFEINFITKFYFILAISSS
jgi:hypothetical protein